MLTQNKPIAHGSVKKVNKPSTMSVNYEKWSGQLQKIGFLKKHIEDVLRSDNPGKLVADILEDYATLKKYFSAESMYDITSLYNPVHTLRILSDMQRKKILFNLGLNLDQIPKIISVASLDVLTLLFNNKEVLNHFGFNKDQLYKILNQTSGYLNLNAIIESEDILRYFKLTAEKITNIVGCTDGYKKLDSYFANQEKEVDEEIHEIKCMNAEAEGKNINSETMGSEFSSSDATIHFESEEKNAVSDEKQSESPSTLEENGFNLELADKTDDDIELEHTLKMTDAFFAGDPVESDQTSLHASSSEKKPSPIGKIKLSQPDGRFFSSSSRKRRKKNANLTIIQPEENEDLPLFNEEEHSFSFLEFQPASEERMGEKGIVQSHLEVLFWSAQAVTPVNPDHDFSQALDNAENPIQITNALN